MALIKHTRGQNKLILIASLLMYFCTYGLPYTLKAQFVMHAIKLLFKFTYAWIILPVTQIRVVFSSTNPQLQN